MNKCRHGCDGSQKNRHYKANGLCTYHYNKLSNVRWRKSKYGRTYHVWYSMKWRCSRKTGYYWKYYGSRGIKVCERWKTFRNFLEDMGYQPNGMTIERLDNDKGYNPSNCEWKTHLENSQNKRGNVFVTIDGETKTVSAWARAIGSYQSDTRKNLLRYGTKWLEERVKSLQV